MNGDEKMPLTRVEFWKVIALNEWYGKGHPTKNTGREAHSGIRKVFLFVETLKDRSTEHEKTAPMVRLYTSYSEGINEVTEHTSQHTWNEEELDS